MLRRLASVLVASCLPFAALAAPPGTAFTYQGILKDGGTNADGVYDMRISLRNSNLSTSPLSLIGSVNYLDDVQVTNGQFTVRLDYGNQFNDSLRWLQIEVRKDTGDDASNGDYDPELHPRPQIVAVPLATNSINLNGQPGAYYQAASTAAKLDASSNTFLGSLQVNNSGTFAGNMLTSKFTNVRFGLTSYNAGTNRPLLNLDANFNTSDVNTGYKGGAVRIDLRNDYPTIQLLTRPAGGTFEYTALSVEESGNVNIGLLNGGYPVVAKQRALKTVIGVVKADGTTTSTGFTVQRTARGVYSIYLSGIDIMQSSVQASSNEFYTLVSRQNSSTFGVTLLGNTPPMTLDADFTFIVTGPSP